MRVQFHLLNAIRYLAKLPCKRSNCGTVCKCPSCDARASLAYAEKLERRAAARQHAAHLKAYASS